MTTFIITSVLNSSNIPLNYNNLRNVFSLSERIEQSLETIDSIRNKFSDVKIIFADCSYEKLSDINKEKIISKLETNDIWCDLFDKEEIYNVVHSPNKSAGEVSIIKYCLENFKIENDIYKISGRYKLDDCFDISAIDESKNYNFVRQNTAWNGYVCLTSLYRVRNQNLYKEMINQIDFVYKNHNYQTSIEKLVDVYLSQINFYNCQLMDKIGIFGKIAVGGDEFRG